MGVKLKFNMFWPRPLARDTLFTVVLGLKASFFLDVGNFQPNKGVLKL